MDDTKNPRKKADGIRRSADAIHARPPAKSPTPKLVREAASVAPQERMSETTEKKSFLERTGSRRNSAGDSHVIHDRYFRRHVLPGGLLLFRNKNVVALLSGIGVTLVAAILLSTVFARVTVTLKPVVESIQIDNAQVVFDASVSDVNAGTRTIPAEFLSFTGSASEDFDATGSTNTDQKASGRVRIYNAFGTSPQALVANTRFITDSGVLFRIPKSVTIPAAKKDDKGALIPQFIETDLVADKAGEGANIAGEVKLYIPGFKGTPKYDSFYAVAANGFSGGGSAGQGRAVTRDDLAAAQQKLSKKVFDDLKQSMAQKIPANFTYVDSLSEIEITSITAPKEKTKTDRFTVEVKAIARVFVFRDADALKLLDALLLKPEDVKMLIAGSADFHYQIKNANYDKKIATVSMNGSIKSKKIIASEEIAMLAAGKKEGSLVDALKARRDIATFRVAFFPPWIFSAPGNASQVIVVIEDPGSKNK